MVRITVNDSIYNVNFNTLINVHFKLVYAILYEAETGFALYWDPLWIDVTRAISFKLIAYERIWHDKVFHVDGDTRVQVASPPGESSERGHYVVKTGQYPHVHCWRALIQVSHFEPGWKVCLAPVDIFTGDDEHRITEPTLEIRHRSVKVLGRSCGVSEPPVVLAGEISSSVVHGD